MAVGALGVTYTGTAKGAGAGLDLREAAWLTARLAFIAADSAVLAAESAVFAAPSTAVAAPSTAAAALPNL